MKVRFLIYTRSPENKTVHITHEDHEDGEIDFEARMDELLADGPVTLADAWETEESRVVAMANRLRLVEVWENVEAAERSVERMVGRQIAGWTYVVQP